MFAKVENNFIVEWPVLDLSSRFPNTSFPIPITDGDLPPDYVRVHVLPRPAFEPTEKLRADVPTQSDGRWVQGWVVEPMSVDEQARYFTERAEQARQQRQEAYRQEADPLFFKSQRGEATHQEWLDKVAEIQSRFPV